MTNSVSSSRAAQPEASASSAWKVLTPLPHPMGFAGMFAAVFNGRLVAGGGSTWDKPNWLKGQKSFSNRIFALTTPNGPWVEQKATIPVSAANYASATTADAAYLAGGIGASGCLRSVFELRAKGDDLVFNPLPDLPHPVGYGTAAIASGRLYVIGGMDNPAAKSAKNEVWSLGLNGTPAETHWRREPDLPGTGVFVASAASDGENLYVFGGMEFDAAGKFSPSRHACRFKPAAGKWEHLADLPEARVGPASPCPVLPGGKIFVVGGYAEVFPGLPRDHPGFSAQTFFYDLARDQWEKGPLLPHASVADRDSAGDFGPSPMLGAPVVIWQGRVVVVSGEVRASVRSPAVLAWPIK